MTIIYCPACLSAGILPDGRACERCGGHGTLNSSLLAAEEWLVEDEEKK